MTVGYGDIVHVTAPSRAVGNRPHGLRHSNAERLHLEPRSLPHQNSGPKTITEEVKEAIK
jgi:hypothetical protein